MQVKDAMSKNVTVIDPNITIKEAAQLMREEDTGFLPVGENDRLVGTVTDRDLAVKCIAEGMDPNQTKVSHAMSQEDKVVYCFEDQDMEEAAKLMGDKQVHRLPILNRDKRLVGVLSIGDIAEHGTAGLKDALKGISRHGGQHHI